MVEQVAEGFFYGPVDLAVTDSGQPFIAVHDYQEDDFRVEIGDAIIATKTSDSWRIDPIPSEGHDGWATSLVLDENGAWHLASIEPSQLELPNGLEYATNVSGEIVIEVVGSGPLPYDYRPSIAISADGIIGISYFDPSGAALKIRRTQRRWHMDA